MSKSHGKSRNEDQEYRKQSRLRDSEYLNHMRHKLDKEEAERRLKLTEYLRLKGELE